MLKLVELKERISFNQKVIAPRLKSVGEDKLAVEIKYCGTTSQIATCQGCGTKYYAGSAYCKSRYCAICAKLRAMAWLCKLVPLLEDYRKQGYKMFMLNLTIKDNANLKYILDKLILSWRIMSHDDKTCRKEFRTLNDGGIRSIEIKLGENSKLWHPHIHSIVLLKINKKVLQYEQYKRLWEHSTALALGTTKKVGSIDIRGLKGFDGDIVGAVVETFKYMTKLDWLNVPNEKLKEMFSATHNRRFISSWGVLYGINKQVEELLSRSSAEELKQHACKVCGCTEFELDNILTVMMPKGINEF